MDVERQITYWRDSSVKAFRSVPMLMDGAFWNEALFWTHLGIKKAFKALVVKRTRDLPPYTHKLIRLAEVAGVELTDSQLRSCGDGDAV